MTLDNPSLALARACSSCRRSRAVVVVLLSLCRHCHPIITIVMLVVCLSCKGGRHACQRPPANWVCKDSSQGSDTHLALEASWGPQGNESRVPQDPPRKSDFPEGWGGEGWGKVGWGGGFLIASSSEVAVLIGSPLIGLVSDQLQVTLGIVYLLHEHQRMRAHTTSGGGGGNWDKCA